MTAPSGNRARKERGSSSANERTSGNSRLEIREVSEQGLAQGGLAALAGTGQRDGWRSGSRPNQRRLKISSNQTASNEPILASGQFKVHSWIGSISGKSFRPASLFRKPRRPCCTASRSVELADASGPHLAPPPSAPVPAVRLPIARGKEAPRDPCSRAAGTPSKSPGHLGALRSHRAQRHKMSLRTQQREDFQRKREPRETWAGSAGLRNGSPGAPELRRGCWR